jgi:hypothetical protein
MSDNKEKVGDNRETTCSGEMKSCMASRNVAGLQGVLYVVRNH